MDSDRSNIGRRKYRRVRLFDMDKHPAIVIQGNLLEYKSGRAYSTPPPPKDKRRITMFSKASRLRMFKMLATLDFTKMDWPVFITLTYPPGMEETSYVRRRQQRFLFVRSMEAALDHQITGLWRTEWEQRKSGENEGMWAPHLHLLLWPVEWIPMSYVNEEWKRILDYPSYIRTEIKRPKGKRGVSFYIAKYCGKLPDSSLVYDAQLNNVDGRHWGYHRGKLLPRLPLETLGEVTEQDADFLYRSFKRVFPDVELPFGESFTLMGDFVPVLRRMLAEMRLTRPG